MIRAAAIGLALAAAPAPVEPAGQQQAPERQLVLSAGTPVPMTVIEDVSSKTHDQGDRFGLSVSDDVVVAGHVIIPRGAAALGEVTRHRAKGGFGKSGKLEIRLLHVLVDGRRVRLDGTIEQRGDGAAGAAAVAGALVSGVLGSAIHGKSASIPAGSRLTGYIYRDIPLVVRRD